MDKHTDEHGTSADERGINTDEHNNQEITIDNVLSTEERTLPNGNTITIIKRTTQTELIVPIRDPKIRRSLPHRPCGARTMGDRPEENARSCERGSGQDVSQKHGGGDET